MNLPGSPVSAALITGSYELNYDLDVTTKGAETEEIKKVKQTLELKYKGFLSPVVENEVTLKIEQEVNSNAPDTTRLLPTLDLAFRGRFWDAKAGGKRVHENSDDPGKNPKTTDNWFVEFLYRAPARVPDLKAKYTIDTDFEEGTTDSRKDGIALSSVYKPNEWLDVKGDYSRDTTDDKLNADSDTEDEKLGGTLGIHRLISEKIKAEAQYSIEVAKGATLLDAGGTTNETEDQTHKVQTSLAFRPFDGTALNGSYDYQLKQNMVNGEHALTTNLKASASQKIFEKFDVNGSFFRAITEARHTADDNEKTEDTWSVDFKAAISRQLDFTGRHDDKHTVEEHVDVTKNKTSTTLTDTASWTGELAPFWKAAASFDRTDTYEWDQVAQREVKTKIDTKYSLKSTFDFKAVNLSLDPTYDIAKAEDLVLGENTETRDFKFKIAYKVLSTRAIDAKIEHTYGRRTDSAAGNIERTDNSTGNVTWKNPLPGWMFSVDATRQAKDTSEDDLPPEITSTFGFKIDYTYQWLAINTSYKYDKKLPEEETDDSETFDAKVAWTAPRWDASLTYTFNKVFSEELDERYSLRLLFKYNL